VRILKGGLGGWTNARLPIEAKSYLPSIGLEIYKNLTMGDIERHRFKAGDVVFLQDDDPRGEAYVIHSLSGPPHVHLRYGPVTRSPSVRWLCR